MSLAKAQHLLVSPYANRKQQSKSPVKTPTPKGSSRKAQLLNAQVKKAQKDTPIVKEAATSDLELSEAAGVDILSSGSEDEGDDACESDSVRLAMTW